MQVTTRMSRLSRFILPVLAISAASAFAQAADDNDDATDELRWQKHRVGRRQPAAETTAEDTNNTAPPADLNNTASRADTKKTSPERSTKTKSRSNEQNHPAKFATPATHHVDPSGVAQIRRAFEQSQDGDTEGHYSSIIAQCEQGIRAGVNRETEQYAERLLSWAYNRRGKVASEMGRDVEALEDFEAAVRYDKTRWRAFHNRGVSYALAGRHEEALADLTRTIELNPRYANAYFNRAELHQERGDLSDALKDYNQVIKLTPSDAAAHNSRGYCYYQMRRFQHAVRDYTEALRLDPVYAAAFANRGQLYSDLGYYARALRDFQRAVDNDPELGRAYQGAAWLLATCPDEKFRDKGEAVAAASKAIELDGDDDPLYLDTLAAAYANAGEFDLAVQAQQASIERLPEEAREGLQRRQAAYQQDKAFRSRPIRLAKAANKAPQRASRR